MAVPKMTTALLGLLVPGILATTAPYVDGQSTETVEPQQIGTATVDGALVYSMNYCTIVQNTECHVSLETAASEQPAPTPIDESSAAYSAPVVSAVPGTDETVVPAEPAPGPTTDGAPEVPVPTDAVPSDAAPGAPEPGEPGVPVTDGQPTPTVISTTDEAGNPTLVTSSALAASATADETSAAAAATASSTGEQQEQHPSSNATTHAAPSGTTTSGPSAPEDHTGAAAALKLLPGAALGAAVMALAFLF